MKLPPGDPKDIQDRRSRKQTKGAPGPAKGGRPNVRPNTGTSGATRRTTKRAPRVS